MKTYPRDGKPGKFPRIVLSFLRRLADRIKRKKEKGEKDKKTEKKDYSILF